MFFFHKKSPNWISGNQYRRPQIENIDVLLFGAYKKSSCTESYIFSIGGLVDRA